MLFEIKDLIVSTEFWTQIDTQLMLYFEFHSINKILFFEFDESVEFSSE